MIADIELTLVSIIQGVALTVLIETSREAVAKLNWIMWPYVLSGLIRTRVRDRTGDVSNRLYTLVKRDQWLNLGFLLPAFFLMNRWRKTDRMYKLHPHISHEKPPR